MSLCSLHTMWRVASGMPPAAFCAVRTASAPLARSHCRRDTERGNSSTRSLQDQTVKRRVRASSCGHRRSAAVYARAGGPTAAVFARVALGAARTFFAARSCSTAGSALGELRARPYRLAPGGARAPSGPGLRAGSSGAAGARGAKGTGARRFCGSLFDCTAHIGSARVTWL